MSESSLEGESERQESPEVTPAFPCGVVEQFKAIFLKSKDFFQSMPVEGGYKDPALFLALTAIIHGVAVALLRGKPLDVLTDFMAGFLLYLFMSGVIFALAKTFGGAGTFQGTFRLIAYSSAPKVFTWIPGIGWLIGLYAIYLQFLGVVAVHKLSRNKALAVVLIPVGVQVFVMIIAIAIGNMLGHKH